MSDNLDKQDFGILIEHVRVNPDGFVIVHGVDHFTIRYEICFNQASLHPGTKVWLSSVEMKYGSGQWPDSEYLFGHISLWLHLRESRYIICETDCQNFVFAEDWDKYNPNIWVLIWIERGHVTPWPGFLSFYPQIQKEVHLVLRISIFRENN